MFLLLMKRWLIIFEINCININLIVKRTRNKIKMYITIFIVINIVILMPLITISMLHKKAQGNQSAFSFHHLEFCT